MYDGFYSVAFTGLSGTSGMGMFTLLNGVLVGADWTGVAYDGTYRVELLTNRLILNVTATVPAGTALVMGVPAQERPYAFRFDLVLNPDFDKKREPTLLTTPYGPVNIVLHKLRNFPTR
jgi:hypothetical protein